MLEAVLLKAMYELNELLQYLHEFAADLDIVLLEVVEHRL